VVVEPIESQVQRKWWTASFHAAPGRESLAPGAFRFLFELFTCVFPRISFAFLAAGRPEAFDLSAVND
jgi:hypothetical protein